MPTGATSTKPPPSRSGEISLYERWQKIHTLWVNGRFQSLRRVTLTVLLLVFYAGPWLTWNGRQAIWFNLPERKFFLFGVTFWPQEFILLSWLLIIAAFALFFFTVLAGRLWCGWACPQTVWTLCFVYIEHWIEGDRNQRLRLDRGPWLAAKLAKKGSKWLLWAALSFSIAFTFVGYFTPVGDLMAELVRGGLGPWERFWLLFTTVASFLMSGVLREQVCIHMCPYARFQSVMFDRDTLIISYDKDRGEPRGSRSRKADPAALGLGACVDCKLCVYACPTGIDIREGLQYQCIGCAACIDVCDDVMSRMGYAPGLIRYSSETADVRETKSLLRPRLVGYGVVLAAMSVAFGWNLDHRVPLELDIIRDRSRLYRENWDGSVENVYTLRIMNREQQDRSYRVRVAGDADFAYAGKDEVTIEAGKQLNLPIRLTLGSGGHTSDANTAVRFTVETTGEPRFSVSEESRFLRPASRDSAEN